jgi:hypothetical protein
MDQDRSLLNGIAKDDNGDGKLDLAVTQITNLVGVGNR